MFVYSLFGNVKTQKWFDCLKTKVPMHLSLKHSCFFFFSGFGRANVEAVNFFCFSYFSSYFVERAHIECRSFSIFFFFMLFMRFLHRYIRLIFFFICLMDIFMRLQKKRMKNKKNTRAVIHFCCCFCYNNNNNDDNKERRRKAKERNDLTQNKYHKNWIMHHETACVCTEERGTVNVKDISFLLFVLSFFHFLRSQFIIHHIYVCSLCIMLIQLEIVQRNEKKNYAKI